MGITGSQNQTEKLPSRSHRHLKRKVGQVGHMTASRFTTSLKLEEKTLFIQYLLRVENQERCWIISMMRTGIPTVEDLLPPPKTVTLGSALLQGIIHKSLPALKTLVWTTYMTFACLR